MYIFKATTTVPVFSPRCCVTQHWLSIMQGMMGSREGSEVKHWTDGMTSKRTIQNPGATPWHQVVPTITAHAVAPGATKAAITAHAVAPGATGGPGQ